MKEIAVLLFAGKVTYRWNGETVEAEFRESMMHRLEKGYILPGQMNILYSAEETAARQTRSRMVRRSDMIG